jgi:MFS family permease
VRRGLAPLRDSAFRRLIVGQLASGIGDSFYAVALPWYVLSAHGGALLLGTVLACYGASRAVVTALGGAAADRFEPWLVMIAADLVRAVALVGFAIAAASTRPSLVLLAPIAIVLAAGSGLFLPASNTIIPALLDDEQLQAGNAVSSGNSQLSGIIGPAIGGPVVALLGASTAFSVDAATFLVSVLSLVTVRRAVHARTLSKAAKPADAPRPSKASGIVALIREQPVLITVCIMLIVANLVTGGMLSVGLPALAHGPLHAGATGYGLLVATFSIGALLGTVAAARLGRPRRPAVVASLTYLAGAAVTAAIPYLGGPIGAGVALGGFGLALGFGNVITNTAIMRWAPRPLLGRVIALALVASYSVYPLSTVLAGLVVHGLGTAPLFPLSGAVTALAVFGALTRRSWRDFGTQPADATPPASRAT